MSKVAARIEKVKTTKEAYNRERHNRRIGTVKSSDKDREHLNEYEGIEGISQHINALEKQINANLKAQGKRALRKDAIKLVEVIISSDSEFFDKYDYKDYFKHSDEFLEAFWGNGNVIGGYTHADEGTAHKHYFVTPIKDGKFNYSAFINGREDLSKFQEELYEFMIAKGYDFEERQKAEVTGKKHEKTRDWAKRVQGAEVFVSQMNDKQKNDYAIKGVLAKEENQELYFRIEELQERNTSLHIDLVELEEKYQGLRTSTLQAVKGKTNILEQMESKGIHFNRIKKQQEKEKEIEVLEL